MVNQKPTSVVSNFNSFREIAEAVPALVTVYNIKTGNYLYVNPAIKKLLGYSAKYFLERGINSVDSLVHPDDIDRIRAENIAAVKMANRQQSERDREPIINFEYRIKHKNGSWRWLHCDGSVFSRDENGKVECVLNASIDITREKETEEQLRQLTSKLEHKVQERTEQLAASDERYRSFLSQSSEAIWRFELDKPIPVNLPIKKQIAHMFKYAYLAECNDALAIMYGMKKAEEIIGARLHQFLIPTAQKNIEYLTAFVKSKYRLTNAESYEKDTLGRERFFQNNLIGIVKDGFVHRAWGTQRDVTELKKIEQRKDDFIALVSHELKTPITSLKLYTQQLQRSFERQGDKKTATQLHEIDKQVNKLRDLINGLLDLSQIQTAKNNGKQGTFVIDSLVKEVVKNIQRLTETHIIALDARTKQKVRGDRARITQVLTNLLNNAIKYSPDAKKIVVTVSKKAQTVIIEVEDFGIGIPVTEHEKIFERFFRTGKSSRQKVPGLGLGLYVSKEIINQHGGEIWLEKKRGRGSIFCFSLPIKNNTQNQSPKLV